MTFDIILAKIYFRFKEFAGNILLDTWKWKLDPWRISAFSKNSACLNPITIEFVKDESQKASIGYVLEKEKTGFFERRVYRLDNGGTLWEFVRIKENLVLLQIEVDDNWENLKILEDNTQTYGNVAFEYLAHIMPGLCLKKFFLTFHGVLLEYQGAGIIISAPSGTGKTTHARLWRDYKNALIINGDRATCGKEGNIWQGWGLPWSGTSGEQINRMVKIKAMVVLERSLQNEAHLVDKKDTLRYVLPHLQFPTWDSELVGMGLDLLNDFLLQIPVIRLCCRADTEAVDVLEQVLKKL